MSERRGVLFDVDGTLIDTTYVHAVTWSEALAQQGRPVATARVHRAIGMGSSELLEELFGPDRPEGFDEAAGAAHTALYGQHWGHLRRLPGARALLRACRERGLLVVLASSASSEELTVLTETLGADEDVDVATSSADAEAGKPHPDLLQTALQKADLEPERAVFVGDAVWDAHAARRAGMPFVGVVCGGTSEAELRDAGAVEIWRDPQDLLDHLDASIVGRTSS